MSAVMDFWSKASEVMLKDVASNNQAQATLDQLTLHNLDQGKQMWLANLARYGYGIDPTPYLSPYGVPPTNVSINNMQPTAPQADQEVVPPTAPSPAPVPPISSPIQAGSTPVQPNNSANVSPGTPLWKKLLTAGLIGVGSGGLVAGGGYAGYQTLMQQLAGQQFQLKINAVPDQPQINVEQSKPIPIPTVPSK